MDEAMGHETSRLVDAQFLAAPVPFAAPTTGGRGRSLILGASAGTVYYTTDGTDPRQSGGGVSPKAKTAEGPLEMAPGTTLFARVQRDSRWSGPAVIRH